MTQDELKQAVARAAIEHVPTGGVIGVGTGSTANYFIDELGKIKHRIDGAVASSDASAQRLKKLGIEVHANSTTCPTCRCTSTARTKLRDHLAMIKGGGGALTREKIVAAVARKFVCIADQSKLVDVLGKFPLPIEVIPMARSYVAREIVKLGGQPALRQGFTTDNGNVILDVHNLQIMKPVELESTINQIAGVVTNGLFARRGADVLLLGGDNGVQTLAR